MAQDFDDDEQAFPPYWAELWASGVELALAVAKDAPFGRAVLEIGCGLGLPSVAAALAGARVLATDRSPDAVAFAAHNARLSGTGAGDGGGVLDAGGRAGRARAVGPGAGRRRALLRPQRPASCSRCCPGCWPAAGRSGSPTRGGRRRPGSPRPPAVTATRWRRVRPGDPVVTITRVGRGG